MAVIKQKTVYVCTHCGCESSKWCGKCPSCGEWNCMEEQLISSAPAAKTKSVIASAGSLNVRSLENIDTKDEFRYKTGMGELDRVLGGGIVKGAVMLISGDPGIGKSTLMLQICRQMEKAEYRVLYVSGEESQRQIKLRADRLGINSARVDIMSCSDVPAIIDYINGQNYDLVIIDSIQTMSLPQVSSSAGSVTQIRECTSALLQLAKSSETPIFIVGHVNKDGAIAGPKVLEHIVDAVLYFEGDKNLSYRILRAVKNRFGSTNEIGVFEMSDVGLCEVPNPSQMLLSGRPKGVPGTCVVCAMEGTRPILAEVQGLVSVSAFGNPRRMSTGYDYNRLNMILAVLEKRSGYIFSNLDVYVNIVGGLRIDEPAADLAVAVALLSSLKSNPVREDVIVFGEIGLAGEVRAVSSAAARVSEAARLGFKKCILPYYSMRGIKSPPSEIELAAVREVRRAFDEASQ